MTWHCSVFKFLFCKSIVITYSYNGHLVIPASKPDPDCVWDEDVCNQQKIWTVVSYIIMIIGAIIFAFFGLIFVCCLYKICCGLRDVNTCDQPGCQGTTAGNSVPPFTQTMPMPMPMNIPKSYNYPTLHQINMQPLPEYGINPSILGPPPSYTPNAPPPNDYRQ